MGQTTDSQVAELNPERDVLFKGRVRVATGDYTLSGSWYRATKIIDLGFLNINTLITVDFYYTDGTLYKGPTVVTSNAGVVTTNVGCFISAGSKLGGASTKITFQVGNNSGGQADIYFRVNRQESAGAGFPLVV